MVSESVQSSNVVGRRMRARREELGWAQEKVGVMIGIDESSSRARISRYELGTHEPPIKTAKLIARALRVPLAYFYCESNEVANLLHLIEGLQHEQRRVVLAAWLEVLKPHLYANQNQTESIGDVLSLR